MEEMMLQQGFLSDVQDALARFDPEILSYDKEKVGIYGSAYRFVEQHAMDMRLYNTAIALPLVRGILSRVQREARYETTDRYLAEFEHCLAVCQMLVNLHIPVSPLEEDILLASALCHIVPENVRLEQIEEHLPAQRQLNPEVFRIVRLLFREDNMSDAALREYFARVQGDKLALLILLSDRGNLVEQLYGMSTWSAHRYIHETRTYFFPMCIFAKEHYHDLLAPVSVLMEKMRSLIEVTEILLHRHEAREAELTREILDLQEENATIKGMIRKYRGE